MVEESNFRHERAVSRKPGRDRKLVLMVPSLVTTGNIFCGFLSVTESLGGAQALSLGNIGAATDHFDRAAVSIGFAYLCDFLDGRIARMTGAATEFGVELDSLADVLSFGIAPAFLAFTWGYGTIPQLHKFAWAVSFVYLICGALRLARFNVQAHQPNPHLPPKNPKVDKKAFVGLPIPAGAALIAAIAHFSPTPFSAGYEVRYSFLGQDLLIEQRVMAVGLLVLTAGLALLMVSTIRYSSFKGVGKRQYHPRFLFLVLALLVVSIWLFSRWTLLMLATVYVAHGIVGKLWSMMRWRKKDITESDEPRLEFDNEPHPQS
ncbi:MAG TPA: phosphatidylcholine/phosphatidylserine synthase [Blastocatellia bacterium]|nr:phosphatidylcholine/phosphatidylserine synthase [Blastocatellia bacterium]